MSAVIGDTRRGIKIEGTVDGKDISWTISHVNPAISEDDACKWGKQIAGFTKMNYKTAYLVDTTETTWVID